MGLRDQIPQAQEVSYPSLVFNFRIRFDETLQVQELPAPKPQGGIADALADGDSATFRPLVLDRGAGNLTHILNRVPKQASIELPGYRTAGTFSCEFDWRDLPIDPRLMRAVGVEIYLGSVTPGDFATGMVGIRGDGTRVSVLKTTGDDGLPKDDLLLLAGVVDIWNSTHNDRGSIVRMEGRDLRGIFLDSPCDPDMLAKLKLTKPINEVILDILRTHPGGTNVNVLANPDDWPARSIPSPADAKGLTRVRRSGDGAGAQSSPNSDSINYWDIITKYCTLVGAVPYFRGRNLEVRPARSLFDQTKPGLDPGFSPFKGGPRQVGVGQEFEVRKMIYGYNIAEMSFERKYTGVKVPVIEVVSIDTSSPERGKRKLLIQEWPPESEKEARRSGVLPSGEASQTDKISISVPGIRDKKRLLEIARNLYEEIGRGEMGGSCRTKSLSSFGGTNEDPDLLRLRAGDTVEFLVDARALSSRAPLASELTDHERRSFEEQTDAVRSALTTNSGNVDENLVRAIVASSRSSIVDLLRFFKTSNVKYTWSEQSGIDIAFDFQNYFVVRSAVTPELGANQSQTVRKAARRQRQGDEKNPTAPGSRMSGGRNTGIESRSRLDPPDGAESGPGKSKVQEGLHRPGGGGTGLSETGFGSSVPGGKRNPPQPDFSSGNGGANGFGGFGGGGFGGGGSGGEFSP